MYTGVFFGTATTIGDAFAENFDNFSKFGIGGEWDAQRVRGYFVSEYRDYATVAIGLYVASAQIPEFVTLNIENAYAKFKSSFPKTEAMDTEYKYLPKRNIFNTRLGYDLLEKMKK